MAQYQLTAEEKNILRSIYTGHDTVADVCDFISKPTVYVMTELEILENLGYVKRMGDRYIEWLRFEVTEKGKQALPEMSELEKKLAENYGISIEDYKVLKEAKNLGVAKNDAFTISDNTGIPTMVMVTCVDNLEKKGYVKMQGLWRRFLAVTSKGEELVAEIG